MSKQMSKTNRIGKIVAAATKLPEGLRATLLSTIFGRVVPLVGTAGIRYDLVTANKVICSIKNRRPVQNHINGVHAAAMALLAETATGFVVGMNVPDDRIMLIKSLHVDYKRPTKGDMRATATLSDAERELISSTEKGELMVTVSVTDESGQEPIQCQMLWAWLPKKKSS